MEYAKQGGKVRERVRVTTRNYELIVDIECKRTKGSRIKKEKRVEAVERIVKAVQKAVDKFPYEP